MSTSISAGIGDLPCVISFLVSIFFLFDPLKFLFCTCTNGVINKLKYKVNMHSLHAQMMGVLYF